MENQKDKKTENDMETVGNDRTNYIVTSGFLGALLGTEGLFTVGFGDRGFRLVTICFACGPESCWCLVKDGR